MAETGNPGNIVLIYLRLQVHALSVHWKCTPTPKWLVALDKINKATRDDETIGRPLELSKYYVPAFLRSPCCLLQDMPAGLEI